MSLLDQLFHGTKAGKPTGRLTPVKVAQWIKPFPKPKKGS